MIQSHSSDITSIVSTSSPPWKDAVLQGRKSQMTWGQVCFCGSGFHIQYPYHRYLQRDEPQMHGNITSFRSWEHRQKGWLPSTDDRSAPTGLCGRLSASHEAGTRAPSFLVVSSLILISLACLSDCMKGVQDMPYTI